MVTHRTLSFPSSNFIKFQLLIFFFFLYLQNINGARPLPDQQTNTDFITTSCKSTLYRDLCFSSLSSYASTIQNSPILLANTALSVSLKYSFNASIAMKSMFSQVSMRPKEASAMRDCMENMGDSIGELRDSIRLMEHIGGRDLGFQLSNIQTWVSAAITDDDTCMDGFEVADTEGAVKEDVRRNVLKVAQLTSNALAFVNCLATSSRGFP